MTTLTSIREADDRRRTPGPQREPQITSRLRKATGQLTGITGMYEEGRHCIDILDQLAAVSAAIDAVALLVLTDHINACVRAAIEHGDAEEKIGELVAAVRRYVRSS